MLRHTTAYFFCCAIIVQNISNDSLKSLYYCSNDDTIFLRLKMPSRATITHDGFSTLLYNVIVISQLNIFQYFSEYSGDIQVIIIYKILWDTWNNLAIHKTPRISPHCRLNISIVWTKIFYCYSNEI